MVIKRISPMSCAKVSGLLYALFGLLVGGVFSLVMMVAGSGFGGQDRVGPMFGALFGAGAVVILPVCYGALGFVGGAVTAALYNLIAGWTGGIELDVQ